MIRNVQYRKERAQNKSFTLVSHRIDCVLILVSTLREHTFLLYLKHKRNINHSCKD